ncbi:MAG: YdcF family protein [Pseudoxanthomonas sp.]
MWWWFWLSPLAWLLASVLVGVVALTFKWGRKRLAQLSMAGIAISTLAMMPLVADGLLAIIEAPMQAPDCTGERTAVVLSGGLDREPRDAQDVSVISMSGRQRAERAAEWWHAGDGRQLVVAGGAWTPDAPSESALMKVYLGRMGVPAAVIRTETQSQNTWDNALNMLQMRPAVPREVVVITSAVHVPRARYAMQQAGFESCMLPSDSMRVPLRFPTMFMPSKSGVAGTEAALHELIGIVWYRFLAWWEPMPARSTF